MKMQWVGMDKYQQAIRRMGTDLDKVESVVKGAVLGTQRDARINAPVDTGRLRADIHGEITTQDRVVYGVVGARVFYGAYQEFGTRRMRPRRFTGKAFDVWKEKFLSSFNAFIGKALRK